MDWRGELLLSGYLTVMDRNLFVSSPLLHLSLETTTPYSMGCIALQVVLTDFPYVELVRSWVESLKAIDTIG